MSDAPTADADKAASDEHERGLFDELLSTFVATEAAQGGMEQRAVERVDRYRYTGIRGAGGTMPTKIGLPTSRSTSSNLVKSTPSRRRSSNEHGVRRRGDVCRLPEG